MATDGEIKGLPRRVLEGPEGQAIRRLEDYARELERRLAALELRLATDESGGLVPSGAAGGDLSGTYPNPKVVALESATTRVAVASATAPTAGQVLTATSGTAANWQTPAAGGVTSFNGRSGAVVPATADYTGAQVTNTSGVVGTEVSDALDTLNAAKANITPRVTADNYTIPTNQALVVPLSLEVGAGTIFEVSDGALLDVSGTGDARSQFTTHSPGRVWHPKGFVASRSPLDDLFDRGTAGDWDYKWRKFDPNAVLTQSIDANLNMGKLVIANGSAANDRAGAMLQAIPASEFVVYVKMHGSHTGQSANGLLFGIILGPDLLSAPTSAFVTGEINVSSTSSTIRSAVRTWTNSTLISTTPNTYNISAQGLRMRVNGTSWDVDASVDCRTWVRINNTSPMTAAFTPAYVGVFASDEDNNNTPETVWVDAFQVISGAGSSGFNATSMGGLL